MSKAFFDVFPTLQVRGDLQDLFSGTQVEKLCADRGRTRLKIVLQADHLLHYANVAKMQRAIEDQIFGEQQPTKVYIQEKYTLSKQYTPKKLMHEYFDSLSMELEQSSRIMGRYFRDARIEYPEPDLISVTLKRSAFGDTILGQLEESLERVFRDRCGVPARFKVLQEAASADRAPVPAAVAAAAEPENYCDLPENGEYTAPAVPARTYAPPAQPAEMPGAQYDPAAGSVPAEAAPWDEAAASYYAAAAAEAARAEDPAGAGAGAGAPAGTGAGTGGASRAEGGSQRQTDAASQNRGGRRNFGRGDRGERRGKGRGGRYTGIRRSDDPNVLYGRSIEEEAAPIADILGDSTDSVFRGQVMTLETREIRGEKTIVKFAITDFGDSICCKIFVPNDQLQELLAELKVGAWLKVRGAAMLDTFDHEVSVSSVSGIMKIPPFGTKRTDEATEKRVELHLHTKMSDMDGVSECKDLVKRAYDWGMPAIAITDHGNVQAFPDANHVREALLSAENKKRSAEGLPPVDPQKFFKVIYGVECYLVDDLKKSVSYYGGPENDETRLDEKTYVVFDLETTGFSPEKDRIIEFGAVKVRGGEIVDRFSEFVDPKTPIPFRITQLTSITDDMVIGADTIEDVLPRFLAFSEGCVLVGHNVAFDIGFVRAKAKRLGLKADFTTVDTMGLARVLLPGHARYTLDAVAKVLKVDLGHHHRAVDDADCTARIFQKEIPLLKELGAETFGAANALGDNNPELMKRLRTHHCILLAQNSVGRHNLYTMVSESHLRYFFKKPRIPKSLLMKYREGILVGSACVMGELFEAVLEDRSEEVISQIASFYDYLEIQPRDNNRFLLESPKMRDKYPDIRTEEDLLDLNRKIVEIGDRLGKPVVATGDVHFMDPEDEIYRSIIQAGMGMAEEDPAPLYFRTTDEMLEEFSYLGAKKAKEVVITNTRRIADMVDAISPVRPDKCPPVIENSDGQLREICYAKAHSMYGDPLPSVVEERLERELNSIIKNGYSVMYIIAQKLVWKSVEDGYLVGSRGSVGSSFVATMSGITEVNPLPPHYYCTNCYYNDFDSPEVRSYAGKSGIDMPAKICPRCGKPLHKDGFDIPFETFLGFKGDKEPDIDLNFSGEYQSKAHAYTKVIFGHEQTFKAGTIGTLADKTAFAFALHYFEDRGETKRSCEIDRLKNGCLGVRRSTGQHPGGIVVLPIGEDINTFTPVQHPANDMTTDIITTHFDYHSIDHNLLKLDILGHDDPTMIRMLQDLTGLDPVKIPLDDQKVMSLFRSTEALGITPEQNGGIQVGSLGIPEFGTKFVIGMLMDTRPTTMSELVRISGLSHGTDVWLGNAQTLIQEGTATLSTAICTRDDIMSYLIGMGMDKSLSFKIMESVRKGKGLTDDMKAAMIEAGVPDWYIASCLKIKYMFPKAHAAAYVMMALRIAYCKVYYPQAYYAAYYSIRASAFSYELMCRGQAELLHNMEELRRKDKLSKKEEDILDDMQIVREMYARGIEFLPIDVYQANARSCRIIDGKIMPALTSIDGMGEKAADALAEAAKAGPFLSREDLWNRSKVPKTVIEKMHELGILQDLPETNQISLFDLM